MLNGTCCGPHPRCLSVCTALLHPSQAPPSLHSHHKPLTASASPSTLPHLIFQSCCLKPQHSPAHPDSHTKAQHSPGLPTPSPDLPALFYCPDLCKTLPSPALQIRWAPSWSLIFCELFKNPSAHLTVKCQENRGLCLLSWHKAGAQGVGKCLHSPAFTQVPMRLHSRSSDPPHRAHWAGAGQRKASGSAP